MKLKYLGVLLATALTVRASTVAEWTFETNYVLSAFGTLSPQLAPEIGNGSMWAVHSNINSGYSTVTGNGSINAFDADHWSVGDYIEFQTSTSGFTNITVSFDQYRSATGPTNWDFEYSVNGTSFASVFSYSITNYPSWTLSTYRPVYTFSVDPSTVASLADNATAYFRLVDDSSPGGTSGASRVDNFTVGGTLITVPVPEPATSCFIVLGAGILFVLFRRNLDTDSSSR